MCVKPRTCADRHRKRSASNPSLSTDNFDDALSDEDGCLSQRHFLEVRVAQTEALILMRHHLRDSHETDRRPEKSTAKLASVVFLSLLYSCAAEPRRLAAAPPFAAPNYTAYHARYVAPHARQSLACTCCSLSSSLNTMRYAAGRKYSRALRSSPNEIHQASRYSLTNLPKLKAKKGAGCAKYTASGAGRRASGPGGQLLKHSTGPLVFPKPTVQHLEPLPPSTAMDS